MRCRCRFFPRDRDWPTKDPHLKRSAQLVRSFWEVLQLLPNRTVWIHGDSVMLQLCDAAFCSLQREGVGRWPLQTSPLMKKLSVLGSGLNFVGTSLPNGAELVCSGIGVWNEAQVKAVLGLVDVALINFGYPMAFEP